MNNAEDKFEELLIKLNRVVETLLIPTCAWLTPSQLAQYLGLSVNTIYKYVSKGTIPYHRIPNSSKLIFNRMEIDEWILEDDTSRIDVIDANKIAEEIWEKI